MILETTVLSVHIESRQKQKGNALKKIWQSPFEFYIVAEYSESNELYSEWNDTYSFTCSIVNTKSKEQNVKFKNQNSNSNEYSIKILPGQSDNFIRIPVRVEGDGTYVVTVNGISTSFIIRG